MQVLINLTAEQKINFEEGCKRFATNENAYKIINNNESYTLLISCKQKEIGETGLLPVVNFAFAGKGVCQFTEYEEFYKILDSIDVKFFETEEEGYKWFMYEKTFLTFHGTLEQLEAFVEEDNWVCEPVIANRLIERWELRDHINEEIYNDKAEDIIQLIKYSAQNRSREIYTRGEICTRILNWIR